MPGTGESIATGPFTTRSPAAGPGTGGATGAAGWLVGLGAVGAAAAALLLALRAGGALAAAIPGLPDPGPVTTWALPPVRLLADVLATLTVGFAVTAAFLLPGDGTSVSAHGWLVLRRAGLAAAGWAVASLALLVLTVSDLLGAPLDRLGAASVISFGVDISQGRSLLAQAGLAAVVAVTARVGVSRGTAAVAAGLALVGLLPPALTGHAAGAGNHQIAVSSLALHVLAAALWAGGLAALLTIRRSRHLPGAAARYSRLALACFGTVAVSGLANAAVRLGDVEQLWRSGYGVLVLGKLAALVLLGALGAAHRTRTLPGLAAGRRGAFARLAAGEVVVFAATIGLAVALSRSPTPVAPPADADPVTEVLGFPMPSAPTVAHLLGQPLPDLFFLTVTVVGIGGYLAGVRRLRRGGHRWPVARTASWIAGLLVLAAATGLGFARYAYVLFSVHMAQHMVLSMMVPILLVGGAPVTLALRALRRPTEPEVRGAREWLLRALHSRAARLLTHPLVALGIYTASLFGLYFSDLLGTLMRSHLGHLAMLGHFVLSGYLLFWVLIGIDPGRPRLPHPILVLIHFAAMMAHGFFGLALMQTTTVIAPDWYLGVHPDWASSLLDDQKLGAGIAWAFGEIPAAVVMVLLVRQWIRADQREQRRLDRAADRAEATGEDDDLARYNAFLAAAARDRN
ncbi:bifunctional copper resistance protein CopD/cytochrome c oxidase assembly protein [Micromonospora robiginosa]|uniref:Bifunctional copper resistance protein CopD/cytochrome c oxidase assembly protein n=1 Tax=Micromonospora robiginosa TaxID=2749844 RepID=A0A7L6BFS6_9ACTN|nr:bifunctional copper resistance protein CopD/cytochrome c oxidase assembly protein [Micromonospora ferruginea]QLQ40490.2 bifunctional copper resistance protein CopD/cytochrome c oxidase assembly protein [Micromonospora ferruginea]